MVERLKPRIHRVMPLPMWKGGPFEAWAHKWVWNNGWRVEFVIGDHDDAMQHCALLFAKVLNRYGEVAENHKHLMALFKTSVINDWITLASTDRNRKESQFINLEEKIAGTEQAFGEDEARSHYVDVGGRFDNLLFQHVVYNEGPLQVALGDLSEAASMALLRVMRSKNAGITWRHVPAPAKAEILSTLFCH